MKNLNTFLDEIDKGTIIKDIQVDSTFIDVIELLVEQDKDVIELHNHIILNDDGTFKISDVLKDLIITRG